MKLIDLFCGAQVGADAVLGLLGRRRGIVSAHGAVSDIREEKLILFAIE
jgi:hypothetical protein